MNTPPSLPSLPLEPVVELRVAGKGGSQHALVPRGLEPIEPDPDLEIIGFSLAIPSHKPAPPRLPCPGYNLPIPDSQSPHTSYPFGLHGSQRLPWNYSVRGEKMFLHSHECTGRPRDEGKPCRSCALLGRNSILQGISDRMRNSTRQGTTYAYLGWNELVAALQRKTEQNSHLCFTALNQTLRQKESLSDYKQLTIAIANKDIPRVARIVHVALKRKSGVTTILEQIMKAAQGVYSVKSFGEEERMLATLLWRLGRAHTPTCNGTPEAIRKNPNP